MTQKRAKVLTTEWLIKCKDMLDVEYWSFEEEDDAKEWFEKACRYALDRDDEETDAYGRTIEQMWRDGEADFGDMGMTVTTTQRFGY